jgi:predicted alpha-1,2-mannosidase
MRHSIPPCRALSGVGLLLTLTLLGCTTAPPQPKAPTAAPPHTHVDLRIGVLGRGDGATVMGSTLPFGSVHAGPDTPKGGNSGYRAGQPIRGFSQLHVSGTGWGQYGNLLLSPQVGLSTMPATHDSPAADEQARPHEYAVRLARWDIHTRLAPTHNAVIYRFDFPKGEQSHVLFNAVHHIPGDIATHMFGGHDKPIPAELSLSEDGRSVSGSSRYTGGFGPAYTLYYQLEFERAPAAFGTWRDTQTDATSRQIRSTDGVKEQLGAWLRFDTRSDTRVQARIAVSFRSVDHARSLLRQEIGHWNYAQVASAAEQAWTQALSAIRVEAGGTPTQLTQFYTALYHAQLMPRRRTGQFERFDPKAPMWDDHYAVWDTWRTLYPLLALIRPDVVRETVQSFVERQRVDGWVSDTFVAGGNRLREQGGNGVDMIIADAWARQVPGIDWPAAYGVLKHNADKRRRGPLWDEPANAARPAPFIAQGWIPAGIMSSSMSLEYSYNDYAAAQLASAIGRHDDAKTYAERSKQWVQLWNPDSQDDGFKGFIMAREADGKWVDVHHRKYSGSWKPYLYESNPWTYSYFAPHQVARLIELMGGKARFIERLEHALAKGYIDIFNEPSFLVPQLFHYVGRPDLSAKWLAHITGEKFTLMGYPGDDDSGAMSSYYVWSRVGLFPNAGQDVYFINGPVFERLQMQRPGHAPLLITRSGKGLYVAGLRIDGKAFDRSWLTHAELQGARRLEFTMSETPGDWATASEPPPSLR